MKKTLLAILICVGAVASTNAQSVPPTTWQEADGSPKVTSPTKIIVSNGTMSVNGKTVTLTISGGGGGSGTVTSVAFTGGLISVANPTTAAALTVAGTSGGVPYFSSASTWASSGALTANALMVGGGAGAAPSTTTTGTGVLTALGVNVGTAGAFVVNGGALGTPSSGTVTNLTGTASININGTVGATTPTTGAFTTITASDAVTLTSTTAANNKITQGAAINIGTTSTDGIILQNTTAAAAGAQQYSPRLRLTGQGWKTTATAASQTVDWIVETQPVQGTANPTSTLSLSSQVNAGGYTGRLDLKSTGGINLTVTDSITQCQICFNGEVNGLTHPAGNQFGYAVTGLEMVRINTNGIGVLSDAGSRGIGLGNSAGSPDVLWTRGGAGNWRSGAFDAASPVAQTLSVQNVVAGTSNTAGATWTHQASLGTSQGAPGRHSFTAGAMIAASGTTQQTAVSRLELGATKVLTNNSATTLVNVTNASNTAAAGVIDYQVEVFDGTDVQTEVGSVSYMVTNKGGAFSGNTVTKFGNAQNATSGTLTVTWAISAANPGVLSVNANSSLTPSTGYPRITYNVRSLSQQAIAVQ